MPSVILITSRYLRAHKHHYINFTDENISIQQRHSITTEVLRHLVRGVPIIQSSNQYGQY